MDEIKERGTTASVQTIDTPMQPNGAHYNKPYYILSREEFSKLVKHNIVPQRIKNFANTNKNNDIWLKYDNVTFNLNKFFKIGE